MTGENSATAAGPGSSMTSRIPRYILLSVLAPRQATSALLQEPGRQSLCWALITTFCLFSALVATGFEWIEAGNQSPHAMLPMLKLEVSFVTLSIYFLFSAALSFVSFLVVKFLWKQLFLFFENDSEVMAALAMSAAFGFLLEPVVSGVDLLFEANESFGPRDVVFAIYVIAGLAFGATYFSEALSIGWIRAFFTDLAALVILIICVGIPLMIAMFALNPDLLDEPDPDTGSEVHNHIRQWISNEQV